MSLSSAYVDGLKAHIEPREAGTMTATGLEKLGNGVLIARHSTETGVREDGQEFTPAIEEACQRLEELEVMREAEQPKPAKSKKKKAAAQSVAPAQPAYQNVRVTVEGVGEIGAQYRYVRIGVGVAQLGLGPMSFVPQVSNPATGVFHKLALSIEPDKNYVYLGNTIPDEKNLNSILLIEIPKGE